MIIVLTIENVPALFQAVSDDINSEVNEVRLNKVARVHMKMFLIQVQYVNSHMLLTSFLCYCCMDLRLCYLVVQI